MPLGRRRGPALAAIPVSSSFWYLATFLTTLRLLGSAGEVLSPENAVSPSSPFPCHQSLENHPMWGGKKRDEGGWCHEEVMGVTPKPLPTSKVAPHTVVEKLLGEAQGMGDVSCLGGGSREPVSIPVPTVRLHRAPG